MVLSNLRHQKQTRGRVRANPEAPDGYSLNSGIEVESDDVRVLGIGDRDRALGRDLDSLGGRISGQHLVDDGLRELTRGDGARGHREVDRLVDDGDRRGAVRAARRAAELERDQAVDLHVDGEGRACLEVVTEMALHGAGNVASPGEVAVVASVRVGGSAALVEAQHEVCVRGDGLDRAGELDAGAENSGSGEGLMSERVW